MDIYIPKTSKPGLYTGELEIEASRSRSLKVPIRLEVLGFALPHRLAFWAELNTYSIPRNAHDYYRIAHQHRCVFNLWRWRPRLQGRGKDRKVIWDDYDRSVGPLLTGEAFEKNHRSGVPVRSIYLPFEDSRPTLLTRQTYNY